MYAVAGPPVATGNGCGNRIGALDWNVDDILDSKRRY